MIKQHSLEVCHWSLCIALLSHQWRLQKRNTTSRKRATNTDCEEVPRKGAWLHGLKEIPASHVILTRTCLGSGSYGACYLSTFRGMNVVVKSLHIHEGKGENRNQAENRVRQELIYEARIVNKLGYHPCLPLLFGVCSEAPPFRLILQFHGDKKTHSSLTISSALSKPSFDQLRKEPTIEWVERTKSYVQGTPTGLCKKISPHHSRDCQWQKGNKSIQSDIF